MTTNSRLTPRALRKINEKVGRLAGIRFSTWNKEAGKIVAWGPFPRGCLVWPDGKLTHTDELPNYAGDLNAMHELEVSNVMTDEQRLEYRNRVYGTANGFKSLKELRDYLDGNPNEWHGWAAFTSTAAQRAEAFILTMESE